LGLSPFQPLQDFRQMQKHPGQILIVRT